MLRKGSLCECAWAVFFATFTTPAILAPDYNSKCIKKDSPFGLSSYDLNRSRRLSALKLVWHAQSVVP